MSSSPDSEIETQFRVLKRARRLKYLLWLGLVASILGITYWGFGFIGFQPQIGRASCRERVASPV